MDKCNYLISAVKDNVYFYPLYKCLDLTLKNCLNEVSIFIYEILGEYNGALSIFIKETDKVYIKAKNIIINKDDFELDIDTRANLKEVKEDLLYKLQRNINVGLKICQKISGKELKCSLVIYISNSGIIYLLNYLKSMKILNHQKKIIHLKKYHCYC